MGIGCGWRECDGEGVAEMKNKNRDPEKKDKEWRGG